MRTTVTLDDVVLAKASEDGGVTERTAPHRASRELVEREVAGRRLAAMGGRRPGAPAPDECDESPA